MREIQIVLAFRVNLNAMTIPNEAVATKPNDIKSTNNRKGTEGVPGFSFKGNLWFLCISDNFLRMVGAI